MKVALEFVLITEQGQQIPRLLLQLLDSVQSAGSLTTAAKQANVSYRKAWNLINQWSEAFGCPLLVSTPGSGAILSELGMQLLLSKSAATNRCAEHIAQLNLHINQALHAACAITDSENILEIAASHCLSHEILCDLYKAETGVTLHIQNRGSASSLAALQNGDVQVAGFHLAEGRSRDVFIDLYNKQLNSQQFMLIEMVKRQQGLIVYPDNPLGILGIEDLARSDLTIANRQQGSGTRLLLDALLDQAGIDTSLVNGYDHVENTHSAVSACVAGKTVDAALGTQAAATRYGLDFIPLEQETYYLALLKDDSNSLHAKTLRNFVDLLSGSAWHQAMQGLDGYNAERAGTVVEAASIFN